LTLIIALDPPTGVDPVEWCRSIFERTRDIATGFKIGLPAIVEAGASRIGEVFRGFDGLVIADLKLADIGDIMALTVEKLARCGFNAVIAHAFVGYERGLSTLSEKCRELGVKLVAVVSMSHPGSVEVMDGVVEKLISVVERARCWGVVAPATRPEMVRFVRSRLSWVKILSPGVGAQGARPGDALCAGADYEIVGRAITRSSDPREAARRVVEEQRRALERCRA